MRGEAGLLGVAPLRQGEDFVDLEPTGKPVYFGELTAHAHVRANARQPRGDGHQAGLAVEPAKLSAELGVHEDRGKLRQGRDEPRPRRAQPAHRGIRRGDDGL